MKERERDKDKGKGLERDKDNGRELSLPSCMFDGGRDEAREVGSLTFWYSEQPMTVSSKK